MIPQRKISIVIQVHLSKSLILENSGIINMKWDLRFLKDKKTLLIYGPVACRPHVHGQAVGLRIYPVRVHGGKPENQPFDRLDIGFAGFMNCFRLLYRHQKLSIELAIRVYISSGFAMSGIYYMIYATHIGCFSLLKDVTDFPSIIDFIYFSFVTVTTVGYGDIAPQHVFVRMLVLCQVLFAVFRVSRVSR